MYKNFKIGKSMQSSFKLQEQDYINFSFYILKKVGQHNWKKMFYNYALMLLIMLFGIDIAEDGFENFFTIANLISSFLAAIVVIPISLIVVFIIRYGTKQRVIKLTRKGSSEFFNKESIVTLDEKYITNNTDGIIIKVPFEKIKNIIEIEENFFVMYEYGLGIILPNNEQNKNMMKEICVKIGHDIQKPIFKN